MREEREVRYRQLIAEEAGRIHRILEIDEDLVQLPAARLEAIHEALRVVRVLAQDRQESLCSRLGLPPEEFEVIGQIGSGATGVLWAGRQKLFDRRVAIKVLVAQLSANPEVAQRFISEAKATALFSHPHIVQVYDIGRCVGFHYISMEFVPGGSVGVFSWTMRFTSSVMAMRFEPPRLVTLRETVKRPAPGYV